MPSKTGIVSAAEFLFLAAVALLIVRNNSYPWPVKRASDILFSISFILALVHFFMNRDKKFFLQTNFRKSSIGLALIFLGLTAASLSAFLIDGQKLDGGGILEIGRFMEAAVIFLLFGFFQFRDGNFHKKTAVSQLSTLAYFSAFFMYKSLLPVLHRFQLLENYPSNVGYYLVVSLSLIAVWFLSFFKEKRKVFFLWYAVAVGLTYFLLWTQTRAAWVAAAISLFLIIFLLFWNDKKKIPAAFALVILLPVFGFLISPTPVKNLFIVRIYHPETTNIIHLASPVNDTLRAIIKNDIRPEFNDPRRIFLWKEYSEQLLRRPLGLGLDFNPLPLVGAVQGPHNTVLQIIAEGGLIGLAGFAYLFYLGFKNIFEEMKPENKWKIYAAGALVGLLTISMFDNNSTFRLMWLISGMAVFTPSSPENEKSADN